MTTSSDAFVRIAGYSGPGRVFLYLIFMLSGFAALLYQLAWQRALYTILGTDIASATIVVTAFLLGLGLGSLLGGVLAKAAPHAALAFFAAFEISLGLFGASSLDLFAWAAEHFAAISFAETAVYSFFAVAFPTILMGATLPLLVAHDIAASRNVGQSFGSLYFANTAGAALGAVAAVTILFGVFGLAGTTHIAATLNAILATGAAGLYWQSRGRA
ncbi:MAG: hypothetical protein HN478_08435 [Rhodospirillaceae bacterium]|jgi:predicted membrane-bound spermidine synthase|nr:hypothetical protein [Rhodospirillaceae bacterium]MBT4486058.1 hypothetical protein [Rhodospirillaceae bacterium]MBT5191648.1 hypothetical protein [Rhodospirillaceae bacterium]MBT5898522.1 hypothetical protein [Rhodospirillaceae bacterium]MBT6429533.1 hypothetical protein [Rhodospirillaceae bacterium]